LDALKPGSAALSVDILRAVLSDVHALHRYSSDTARHGLKEYWVADLHGDCEDFALSCQQRLKTCGVDSDLVLCRTETGTMHLICCSRDGWCLDNRFKSVLSNSDLPYEWLKIGRDGVWSEIEDV
jgi:predicted transglutaminase-like cysteine proteinase